MRRIAHVHLPKTAGNSVHAAFLEQLGADRCALFVTEPANHPEAAFVSAHAPAAWFARVWPDAFKFTFFREPVAQLVSHIRWIDHYNEAEFAHEKAGFPQDVRDQMAIIGAADFSNPASLDQMFRSLSGIGITLLCDNQTRGLLPKQIPGRLDPTAASVATDYALLTLDFFGFVETLEEDLPALMSVLGLQPPATIQRDNAAMATRRIDIANPEIAEVLGREVVVDTLLYRGLWAAKRATQAQRATSAT